MSEVGKDPDKTTQMAHNSTELSQNHLLQPNVELEWCCGLDGPGNMQKQRVFCWFGGRV